MKAADRAARAAECVQLFLAGHSYRDIADAVGFRSPQSVANVLVREFEHSPRRALLADQAWAIAVERQERLWAAWFPRAVAGDHRAAELCRKLLGQQIHLYGVVVEKDDKPLPAPTPTLQDDDDGEDELSRLRAQRNAR